MNLLQNGGGGSSSNNDPDEDDQISTGNSIADSIFNRNRNRTGGGSSTSSESSDSSTSSQPIDDETGGVPDVTTTPSGDFESPVNLIDDETGGVPDVTPSPTGDFDSSDPDDGPDDRDPREIWQPTPSTDEIMDDREDSPYERDPREIWEASWPDLQALTEEQNRERQEQAAEFQAGVLDSIEAQNQALVQAISEMSSRPAQVVGDAIEQEATDRATGPLLQIGAIFIAGLVFVGLMSRGAE